MDFKVKNQYPPCKLFFDDCDVRATPHTLLDSKWYCSSPVSVYVWMRIKVLFYSMKFLVVYMFYDSNFVCFKKLNLLGKDCRGKLSLKNRHRCEFVEKITQPVTVICYGNLHIPCPQFLAILIQKKMLKCRPGIFMYSCWHTTGTALYHFFGRRYVACGYCVGVRGKRTRAHPRKSYA